ncbi:Single-strand binding protein/Primosomal replication protein n [metagenome]|uniref:Single-strand binding protein/Primosomal replication protein n n=1 Tax=metagenome TaxID=256318 RepID=A0A2P2CAM7_9ZZZZ
MTDAGAGHDQPGQVMPVTAAEAVAPNVVVFRGRVSADPEPRRLPSGDVVWSLRVVVPRTGAARERAAVDTLDCAVWSGRIRRAVQGWRAGDVVEVRGAVRRRFFRSGGVTASRVEVEVSSGRVIRRAATA